MKKMLIIAFILLASIAVILLGIWAFCLVTDVDTSISKPIFEAEQGFIPQDNTRSFYIKQTDYPFAKDTEAQKQYLSDCVDVAIKSDFNTILFETTNGQTAMFKDKYFALATGEGGFDALAFLSGLCQKQNLALYAVVNPFAIDTALQSNDIDTNNIVFLNDGDYILPSDEKTMANITKSILSLAKKYPTTGIIFKTPNMADNLEVWQAGYTKLFETVKQNTRRQVGVFSTGYTNTVFDISQYKTLATDNSIDILFCQMELDENPVISIQNTFADTGLKTIPVLSTLNTVTTASNIFIADMQNQFDGICIYNIPSAAKEKADIALVFSALNKLSTPAPVFDAQINQSLKITYPTPQDEKIYSKTCFVIGNSDPSQPLYLDGVEIVRQATQGSFGVLVDLAVGDNAFTFTQGDKTETITIHRYTYSGGGGGGRTHDGSAVATGKTVQITPWFASSLTDPRSEDNISFSIPQNATALVVDSIKVNRGSKTTYAYKLQSGEYVMASRVKIVDTAKTVFTGLEIEKDAYGEYINFVGNGTPMATPSFEKNTLALTFYNTDISASTISESEFFSGYNLLSGDNGETTITFNFSGENPLWGYQLEYTPEGTTRLYLKKTPVVDMQNPSPLSGIRIMLDAGHGGKDPGAPGIGGATGKTEKDFNLAVTLATKYRLEQLGATVLLTRSDDTNISLEDRSRIAFAEKPDIFLALHHNSTALISDVNETQRVESYYFEKRSQDFAQMLFDNIAPATDRADGTAAWNYFYVNRMTVCPSVLFEYGFMVSPVEYEHCANNNTIIAEAFANAQAIIDYIDSY